MDQSLWLYSRECGLVSPVAALGVLQLTTVPTSQSVLTQCIPSCSDPALVQNPPLSLVWAAVCYLDFLFFKKCLLYL